MKEGAVLTAATSVKKQILGAKKRHLAQLQREELLRKWKSKFIN